MRQTIQPHFLILLLGATGASWAQGTTPLDTGTVYRCSLPEGGRKYTTKIIPGAECAAVSRYTPAVPDKSVPPGWIYLTRSTLAYTYVQPDSIRRDAGKVGVWVMESYAAPQTNTLTRAPFQSALRRLSVRCEDRQITAHKTTFTSETYGRGEYVGEWRPLGVYGDFATPGSIDDAIAAYVCRAR